jgi:hypothetical protein
MAETVRMVTHALEKTIGVRDEKRTNDGNDEAELGSLEFVARAKPTEWENLSAT